MRENVDLERKILNYLEENDEFNKGVNKEEFSAFIDICGIEEKIVTKHLDLLRQRNFINVVHLDDDDGFYYDYVITGITATGYDFIVSTRNNKVWESIKEKLTNKGLDIGLTVIVEYLPIIIKTMIER